MATLFGKAVMGILPAKSLRRAVVKSASQKMRWRLALPCEEKYWADYISQKGGDYAVNFQERMDPRYELQRHVRELIDVPATGSVRILDVGAGPLTVLGKQWEGRPVEIVPVDPLANDYARLLKKHGVNPPVRTTFCCGENVAERFGHSQFDLAYSRNALDHSYDPMAAIAAMLAVVKPGAAVLLEHLLNEGETEKYYGLHQWNFCGRAGRFIIWNKLREIDVAHEIGDRGEVSCQVDGNWLKVIIRKRQG